MNIPFRSAAVLAASLCVPAWNSTIVGGRNIQIEEAPWQLWAGNCGASWIGKNWVVTAHHCISGRVSNPTGYGVCGGISNRSECTSSNRVMTKKIWVAPGQNGLNQDVALLELQADITAVKAKPIKVISKAQVDRGLERPGVAAFMSGWGRTSQNGSSPQQLQGLDTKVGSSTRRTFISTNKPGTGLCPGDSGGPLVVKDENGQWILVGAASYITGPCGDNTEDFFGRVSAHLDWIYSTTGIVPTPVAPKVTLNMGGALSYRNQQLYFHAGRAGEVSLRILAADGHQVWETRGHFQGGRALDWNSRPGTYLVHWMENGFARSERLVIAGR